MRALSIKCVFLNRISKLTEMNRVFNRFTFAVLALSLLCGQARAQFTTTFAKNASPGQQSGLYYSLPQTLVQLDFVIRESVNEKGPLSDYADDYFENEDYVGYASTSYELLDLRVLPKATPDPNATFFVTFASVRGSGKPYFDVLPNGIIRSVGTLGNKEEAPFADIVNREVAVEPQKSSLVREDAFFPLLTAGKSNAQLAKEVVDKIEEIRKAKFYLISGDVEMASNPETFNAMCAKLDEAEQRYLSLFLGKRTIREVVRTVYVAPDKENPVQTVAKFSEREGLTLGTSGSGDAIIVEVNALNTTAVINAPSQSAVESISYDNMVFYRIPELADVKVTFDKKVLAEERMTVNQLGALLTAPIAGSKLQFDTNTGQIVNMRMQ